MPQLKSTNQVAMSNGIKVAVYGQAGAGKTVLCSTAPNPVILSAESGLLSLRKFNLPYLEIKNYDDLVEAYKWLTQSNEGKQFDSACLDSLSEIAEVILSDLLKKHKDPRQAYGKVQDDVMSLLRSFRDMPERNVYFAMKEEYVKDSTGAMVKGPSLPGNKLPQAVPYFFDELFQLFVHVDPTTQQETRALRTRADNMHAAKDRSGALDYWEPCDLSHVFNKIRNS